MGLFSLIVSSFWENSFMFFKYTECYKYKVNVKCLQLDVVIPKWCECWKYDEKDVIFHRSSVKAHFGHWWHTHKKKKLKPISKSKEVLSKQPELMIYNTADCWLSIKLYQHFKFYAFGLVVQKNNYKKTTKTIFNYIITWFLLSNLACTVSAVIIVWIGAGYLVVNNKHFECKSHAIYVTSNCYMVPSMDKLRFLMAFSLTCCISLELKQR